MGQRLSLSRSGSTKSGGKPHFSKSDHNHDPNTHNKSIVAGNNNNNDPAAQSLADHPTSSSHNNHSRTASIKHKIGSHLSRKSTRSKSTRSRVRSITKVLSNKDRSLIIASWDQIHARGVEYQERLILRTWLRASAYSPRWIWDHIAGVKEGENEHVAELNPRFRSIVQRVVQFLDRIICELQLETEALKEECQNLGRKHLEFFDEGFQPSYWDSFSVSMIEGIEAALLHQVEEEPSMEAEDECWRTLYAWQKFIRVIIDLMRTAYLDEAGARGMLSVNGTSRTSSNANSERGIATSMRRRLSLSVMLSPALSHRSSQSGPPGIQKSPLSSRVGSRASSFGSNTESVVSKTTVQQRRGMYEDSIILAD